MQEKLSLFELNRNEKENVTAGQASDSTKTATVTIGPVCSCGCVYVDCGGSSSYDNTIANCDSGLHTPADASCD